VDAETFSLGEILFTAFGVYVVVIAVFLISENRRPQATLAWLLVLYAAPGLGFLIYLFFGRHWKAFSRQHTLLMQDLEPRARPLLAPLLSRQEAEISRLEREDPVSRKLMMLVRRNSRSALTRRNRVEILQNASAFYSCLMEDFEAAQHSIHLQYYIWQADPFTEQLKELLIRKARQGVKVRLLYDAIGSRTLNRRYRRALHAAGIVTAPTSPHYLLHTLSYRNHRKITVIDGVIGYTGGMNIGQEHLDGGKGFDFWRDTQVRFVGEASAVLQSVFMVDWYNAVREDLFTSDYYPRAATEPEEGDVPVQILTSGPDARWSAVSQLYSAMVVSAEHHVVIQSPYFILSASLAESLGTAAMSGVDVKVMLSARPSGNPIPAWASNTFIPDMIEAGVRVFLYQKGYLHAKTISIDSRICSIGSANIDIRSFSINYELNAILYSEALATELEQAFAEDLESCTEFELEEYARRNRLVRFRDSTARLLSPLL